MNSIRYAKPAVAGQKGDDIWVVYPAFQPSLRSLFNALASSAALRTVAKLEWRTFIARREGDNRRILWLPVCPWGPPFRRWLHVSYLRRIARNAKAVVFTRPDQADLLDAFPRARRVYYVNDDYRHYGDSRWEAQERRMLQGADRIAAVSSALAAALAERSGRLSTRIAVIANGVDAAAIPSRCPEAPGTLPENLDLPRPLAGVLGRISSRLRLAWLCDVVEGTPWLTWLFVGDVEAGELRESDRPRLARLQRHPRCRFIGHRAYSELPGFAAALDVAVVPYSGASVNPLGSSTRLFLHLPFGTPILATPGCAQVEEFVPLVEMCESATALIAALGVLREKRFDDGRREARWLASKQNTWSHRADQMLALIDEDGER